MKASNCLVKLPQEATIKNIQAFRGLWSHYLGCPSSTAAALSSLRLHRLRHQGFRRLPDRSPYPFESQGHDNYLSQTQALLQRMSLNYL